MGSGNLRYAVLGFVGARAEGLHGYRLKSDMQALCDDFWQVNYGKMYRILDVLERAGELTVSAEIQNGRPNRKVYRITERGRQSLDDWLLQPVSECPRPLRDELSLKLLFLKNRDIDTVHQLVKQQRSVYLTRLARISRRRIQLQKAGFDMDVTELILDGAEIRIRADLAWLDNIERKLLRRSQPG
ncbi:MAG: PadR family transcriptional regulator [Deltaproteobacteria bacterium]|nr:MAG: PadR family transcriptional regulator [Deltaproteobacteria bacterium]